ncbi:hypothetical protein J4208_05435 [Candidatus Woesearchaeota archaeon]|nr:hypothetical protein [Candidatus Woesearchaeota archaeon]
MGLIFVNRVEIYDLGTMVKPTSTFKPVVGERDVVKILGPTKGSKDLTDVDLERRVYLTYCLDFLEQGHKENRSPSPGEEVYVQGDGKVLERVSFTNPTRFSRLDASDQHPYFTRVDSPYHDVILETDSTGTVKRYMEGGLPGFRKRKFDLKKWDADVIERLKNLPKYVRRVLNL